MVTAAETGRAMTMTPVARKIWLALHLVASVGWIGAVIAYLALDVPAAMSSDAETMRAALLGMRVVYLWVIVPLAFLSLITGLIMSLGTPWGLLRHYWVLFSFILTAFALSVVVVHAPDVTALSDPMGHSGSGAQHASGRGDFLHATLGLLVLVVITVLNIFKPRGLTPYGWRAQTAQRARPRDPLRT